MSAEKVKIAVIGASGYTGADAIRLLAAHPHAEIAALTANSHAGKPLAAVFPQFAGLDVPDLQTIETVDWDKVDAAICGLPHGTSQDVIKNLPKHIKTIDMSADFRLKDAGVYADWYGRAHDCPELLAGAVYGLTEHHRAAISAAHLVACPGCYPTAVLTMLLPVVQGGQVVADDLVIDAKSGVSGAGRGLKESNLFAELAEGMNPYSIASHRHAPEIEQELSAAAGQPVTVSFTPHLVPMNRGELVTIYARTNGAKAADIRKTLSDFYEGQPFVRVLPEGGVPATRHVRGSNFCLLGVFDDRLSGRVILVSTLDNLVKGSSGQAIQNMNLMFGLDETAGLLQQPLYP